MQVSVSILVGVFVVLMILLLQNFMQLMPYIADSFFRARGSSALENSVRVSRDRDTIALVMLLPATFLTFRYRLYAPSFLEVEDGSTRLLLTALSIAAFLLLRLIMYLVAKPRRRYDFYQIAHHASYTFFLLLVLLALLTAGVLSVFGAEDGTIRTVLYVEIAIVYLVYLMRWTQILSLSCNQLRTFLYLCALEFIPAAALILSAVLA